MRKFKKLRIGLKKIYYLNLKKAEVVILISDQTDLILRLRRARDKDGNFIVMKILINLEGITIIYYHKTWRKNIQNYMEK